MCSFLDLSKAFDKVPHRPLMDKLASLHVDPYVLRWLSDYLCQRSQYVAVNGEISTSSKVISGVPQGSVLGPLLFLIYINGISEVELHNGTIILYADDILLHRRIQSQADYLLLQKDIDNIRAWFMANYMMLNIGKCKYMVISRKCFPIQPMFSLSISNFRLEKVLSVILHVSLAFILGQGRKIFLFHLFYCRGTLYFEGVFSASQPL